MSCWNVRVIKWDGVYGLGEVFYDLEGKANGWIATSEIFADTREQLLERVMSALRKPVLVPNEDGTAHTEEPALISKENDNESDTRQRGVEKDVAGRVP